MLDSDFLRRLWREIQNLVPLFRYLILQSETHSFCLALAAAALVAFFPSCLVMLSVFKDLLRWQGAHDVLLHRVVQTYFPVDQAFVIRNLDARLTLLGHPGMASLLWILLGAAGI